MEALHHTKPQASAATRLLGVGAMAGFSMLIKMPRCAIQDPQLLTRIDMLISYAARLAEPYSSTRPGHCMQREPR